MAQLTAEQAVEVLTAKALDCPVCRGQGGRWRTRRRDKTGPGVKREWSRCNRCKYTRYLLEALGAPLPDLRNTVLTVRLIDGVPVETRGTVRL